MGKRDGSMTKNEGRDFMKRRGLLLIGILLGLLVPFFITGCGGGGGSSSGSAPQSTTTRVTVNVSQAKTASIQANSGLPAEIVKIRITISGPGMTTVTREAQTSGKQSIQELFDLPNGTGRCILAEALDASGIVIYRGDVYADLNGIALIVDLTIVGNDTTPPAFGGIKDIPAINSSSLTLSWLSASDNVTPQDRMQYLIYGTTAKGTENYSLPNFVTGPGATTFAATGLLSDMNYCFVVRAKDEAGNIETNTVEKCARTSLSSSGNSSGGAQNDTLAPTVPSNLTAAPAGMNRVNLAWEPSSDNYSVAGYKIYRDGTYITTVTSTSWVNIISSYADPGLTANTQYCYAVSAIDSSNNESARTLPVCATTPVSFFTISTTSICENDTACPAATSTLTITFDSGTSPFFISSSNPQIIPNAGPINVAGLAVSAKAKTKAVAGSDYTLRPVAGSVVTDKPITLTVSDSAGLSQDVIITILNQPGLYVNAVTGSTAGDGSSINPFMTLSSAVAASAGNETIDVAPGTYSNEAYPIVLKDGIYLRCPQGTNIIASTTNQTIQGPGPGKAAQISGCIILGGWPGIVIEDRGSNLSLSSITLDGQNNGSNAIFFTGNSLLQNSSIRNFTNWFIALQANDSRIIDNIAENLEQAFVTLWGGSPTISGNKIRKSPANMVSSGVNINGNSTPNIINNDIYTCQGISATNSNGVIKGNSIYGDNVCLASGAGDGISANMSSPTITGNNVFNHRWGIYVFDGRPTINDNAVYCNLGPDLLVSSPDLIDARNNHWDHAAPALIVSPGCPSGTDVCYDSAKGPAPLISPAGPPITTPCPPGITK